MTIVFDESVIGAYSGCAQDIGSRREQQDRVGVFFNSDSVLLVLIDGMGGHDEGAVASEIVLETARERHLRFRFGDDPVEFLGTTFRQAWENIRQYREKTGRSPHAVCVMALIDADNMVNWAYVGDSRLYFFRPDCPPVVTQDHSVVRMLMLQGDLSEAEAEVHPDRGKVYKSLGGKNYKNPGFGSCSEPLKPGDALLLCSDGLWSQLTPDDMRWAIETLEPKDAASELVRMAAESAGDESDNVSAVIWCCPD